MRWVFLALMLVLCKPAFATDEAFAPSLGITRAEFFMKLDDLYPGISIPGMSCGKPLLLKVCTTDGAAPLRVSATETYRNMDRLEAFNMGAEGLLYAAEITLGPGDNLEKSNEFVQFFALCAGMARITGMATDESTAFDAVTAGFEEAVGSMKSGFGEWVRETPHGFLVVDVELSGAMSCMVTAQWA